MIYILTGEIRSGKTTALQKWIENRHDVDGLFCPDNDNGKRFFLKLRTKEEFELEVDVETEEVIKIGNFRFLRSAFDDANEYLISITSKTKNKYLIIDEIGKLELKNQGLHTSAKQLIMKFQSDTNQHIILVVRDYLLDEVLEHYSISNYIILKKEDLKLLD